MQRQLEQLAWLTDSAIPIPGLNARIGIDPLIGLIPGFGDTIGAVISSYIIAQAARLGAPRSILIKMAFNVVTDTIIGAIPGVGDLFDFGWKANQRNVRLLAHYVEHPRKVAASSRLFVLLLVLLLIGFIVFVGVAVVLLARVMWNAASSL